MKKRIAFALVLLCLFGIVSCAPAQYPKYGNTVSYVGWSDDRSICDGALNKELLQSETGIHLPIFKMDTLEDLKQFRAKYETVLAMDRSYGDVLSFEDALTKAQWDRESFFEEHSLLVVYVPSNSGSLRFGVHGVKITDRSLCVSVEQKNAPEIFTDDMAGWFILVEVEDEEIQNCNSFDAIFGNS